MILCVIVGYRTLAPRTLRGLHGDWWRFPDMDGRSLRMVLLGIFLTTFCAVALSNYAIFQLPLAVFSVLGSMTPIMSIPVVWLLKNERCSWRAILGSTLAVVGVIPLYL
jgi:drug/metabolite transporter (DMT)-like permease